MALVIKIKEEFKNKRLAFGKSANPLYKRSEQELIELAILAHESKSKNILRLFEKLPDLAALKKAKVDQQLQKIAPVVVKEIVTEVPEKVSVKKSPWSKKITEPK